MKKILLALIILLFVPTCHEPGTSYAQVELARMSPAMVGGGVPVAAVSCSATPFASATGLEAGDNFSSSESIFTILIPNAVARQICKVELFLGNYNVAAVNVTVQIRTSYNGGGSLLGSSAVTSIPVLEAWNQDWYSFNWSSEYPETSGNIYVNFYPASGGENIWFNWGDKSGWTYYSAEVEVPGVGINVKVYGME